MLEAHDAAVATSGDYERGLHVRDGRTGRPAAHWRSVTVAGADLTTVDVLATAAMALGAPGVDWAVAHGALAAFAVAEDGSVTVGSTGTRDAVYSSGPGT